MPALLSPSLDGLLHPLNAAQSRAQLFSGFGKSNLGKPSKRNVHSPKLLAASKNASAYSTGKHADKPEIDVLIASIINQAETEGSLTQAFQKISTEDWSKVLSNVGRKHWELALAVFGIFKETSIIFLKPNPTEENGGLPVNILKVYTTMVSILSRHGRLEEAESILTEVQHMGFALDLYLYNALLTGYAKKGMSERMLDCLVEMQRFGIQPDHTSYEQLVVAYLNMETPAVSMALEVLEHMHNSLLKPSHKTYSDLISACYQKNDVDNADKCFSAMVSAGYVADSKMFSKLMQLHAQTGNYVRTEELFQMLRQAGLQANSTCYEHLLLAYCKSGCLNQAFSLFREAKQILKPSLLVYNILLDACAKAGLHLQAMQLYREVCGSGLKANSLTYTSAITALVKSGRCSKAEEVYHKMIRMNIPPTAQTYIAMIEGYTIKGWTRAGHEVSMAMRGKCIMTPMEYNAMLNLYLSGNWYIEAANTLSEMDTAGIEPCTLSYVSLVATCAESSADILPVVRSLETSRFEVCRRIYQLMFLPLYHSKECLLEGNMLDLPPDVVFFLRGLAETRDAEANLCFYNSIMDGLWRKGLKQRAKAVMYAARSLLHWYKRPKIAKSRMILDLRGLSLGAAQVAVLDWLSGAAEEEVNNYKMVLITGNHGSDYSQKMNKVLNKDKYTQRAVKKAVCASLAELGSPFVEVPHGSGRLVASVHDVVNWQAMYGIASALMLLDNHQPYTIQ